ncbi:MAG: hypothetical protein ACKOE7_10050 [Actinomycetota bacterium]
MQLRERALQLAEQYVPSPEQATVFTADGTPQHASDDYFLSSVGFAPTRAARCRRPCVPKARRQHA